MIVSNIKKLNFKNRICLTGDSMVESTFIELQDIWGNVIYRIEKKGKELTMKNCTFVGYFDYLKIFRHKDPLIDSFKLQVYCEECGDAVYKLTGKLPLLIKIKTDFDVTKDTRKS